VQINKEQIKKKEGHEENAERVFVSADHSYDGGSNRPGMDGE